MLAADCASGRQSRVHPDGSRTNRNPFHQRTVAGGRSGQQQSARRFGVPLGDYDGDGWCDIFLCNLNGSSRLYRNLGNWKFQDVTEEAGLANTNELAKGAVFADVNGDGYLDLLVTYSGKGPSCF